ncbi:MAG: isoaspartyl peptidase/L-asparaginase family protein [Candidatus Binatales bacterium]
MSRRVHLPALIVHGGAGTFAAGTDRPARRRGMIAAAEAGAAILREGGSALDAAIAAVVALENDPLFNAGYGSMLNADRRIEMDAGLMVAEPAARSTARTAAIGGITTGAVAAVSRVRNPILLARAVMEHTPHILMVGAGAENLAREAGIPLCAPDDMVAPRALTPWRKLKRSAPGPRRGERRHGTVGAVAADSHGALAAATSTGGYPRKLAGRVGDSPILGAGFFADHSGAASATGLGEAIIRLGLCRAAVMALRSVSARAAAARAIAAISRVPADAGIIVIDRQGNLGYAHNADMGVAMFDPERGLRYERVRPNRTSPNRT